MEYYIYITNKCNMNCSYCSVMMDEHKSNIPAEIKYSLDDLRKFVDKIQSSCPCDKNAVIYFFGGEPTLNYEKIYEIMNKFQGVSEYNVTYVLHTNGLLLGEIPEKIISKINVIFLSLNYERMFDDGLMTPYFSKIVNTITRLKKDYPLITIGRFTVSTKTSLYTQASMSCLFFDYIYWQLDNQKQIENIEKYKANYIKDVELLFDVWLSFLKKGLILRYIPFLSIIKHILCDMPVPIHYYCGYGDDIVYIQTDGSCHGCCDGIENRPHYIGNLYKGIEFKDMMITSDYCQKCDYLKICGGRCGRMHKDFDVDRINNFCEMNIFLFEKIKSCIPEIQQLINANPQILEAINDVNMEYTELIP